MLRSDGGCRRNLPGGVSDRSFVKLNLGQLIKKWSQPYDFERFGVL
jgi:hypothetical protein